MWRNEPFRNETDRALATRLKAGLPAVPEPSPELRRRIVALTDETPKTTRLSAWTLPALSFGSAIAASVALFWAAGVQSPRGQTLSAEESFVWEAFALPVSESYFLGDDGGGGD